MINGVWFSLSPKAHFLANGTSYHTPIVVTFDLEAQRGRGSFKFFDMWCRSELFEPTVKKGWNTPIDGTKMFCTMQKLKGLKSTLRELNKSHYGNIYEKVQVDHNNLTTLHMAVQMNPSDRDFINKEVEAAHNYKKIKR